MPDSGFILTGICGSKGYCTGSAVVKNASGLNLTKTAIKDASAEIERFRIAQNQYYDRLAVLAEQTKKTVGADAAEIFTAYQHIVKDEAFFELTFKRVIDEKINIEYAIDSEQKKLLALFESIDDAYLRERANDIKNVCNELIRIMMGIKSDFLSNMAGKSDIILVAGDLTPAEAVKLDRTALRGLVMEHGGVTSHTVILAKAQGIPAVVGVRDAANLICDGDYLQIDAFLGEVAVNPDEDRMQEFALRKSRYNRERRLYEIAQRAPAVTRDGYGVSVSVNTGDPVSIRAFDAETCDGVGLFRTEFIYMSASDFPGEDAQFEIYKDIAARAKGKDVIIRTLDIGGEKHVPYMDLPREENPVLGFRAIRVSLGRKDIFAAQLRAILRASIFGEVRIMFPMIVGMEELDEAIACVEIEKQRLRGSNIPFREDIKIGIMIETPAAVLLSDKLAAKCDFFSIGSNDLIQYTTATDRMNELTQWLYDSCNVSVLRSVNIVAENAVKAGIPWSICGEVASEPRLIPLWVAMGVSQLSVASPHVGEVKHLINRLDRGNVRSRLAAILDYDSTENVKDELDNILDGLI